MCSYLSTKIHHLSDYSIKAIIIVYRVGDNGSSTLNIKTDWSRKFPKPIKAQPSLMVQLRIAPSHKKEKMLCFPLLILSSF